MLLPYALSSLCWAETIERALELAERAKAILPENGIEDGITRTLDIWSRSILLYTLGMAYTRSRSVR